MRTNKRRRAIGFISLGAGLIGLAFAIPGTIEFMLANALWAQAPEAGAWYFAQARWWLGSAFVGFLIWLGVGALLAKSTDENPTDL